MKNPSIATLPSLAVISLLVIISLSIGCASVRDVHQVKLDSDPEGAHVFLTLSATPTPTGRIREIVQMDTGREYLGVTPCMVSFTGDGDGCFVTPKNRYVSTYVGGSATFTAEPPRGSTNLFPQSISYRGNNHYVEGDRIPRGIFFDLHNPPL